MTRVLLFGQEIDVHLHDEKDAPVGPLNRFFPQKGTIEKASVIIDPIFTKYRRWFFTIAMDQGCNYHDAEDLVQDTYLKALKSYETLRNPDAIVGWIKVVISNAAKNAQRGRNRLEFFRDLDYNVERKFGDNGSNFASRLRDNRLEEALLSFEKAETADLLKQRVTQLDALSYEAIQDFYFTGMSISEISDLRGLPEGTVKRRLFTARNRLRVLLGSGGENEM